MVQTYMVANYIIHYANKNKKEISNPKLQKIIYFLNKDYEDEHSGQSLVNEEPIDSDYGPIYASVYLDYMEHEGKNIPTPNYVNLLDGDNLTKIIMNNQNEDYPLEQKYYRDTITSKVVSIYELIASQNCSNISGAEIEHSRIVNVDSTRYKKITIPNDVPFLSESTAHSKFIKDHIDKYLNKDLFDLTNKTIREKNSKIENIFNDDKYENGIQILDLDNHFLKCFFSYSHYSKKYFEELINIMMTNIKMGKDYPAYNSVSDFIFKNSQINLDKTIIHNYNISLSYFSYVLFDLLKRERYSKYDEASGKETSFNQWDDDIAKIDALYDSFYPKCMDYLKYTYNSISANLQQKIVQAEQAVQIAQKSAENAAEDVTEKATEKINSNMISILGIFTAIAFAIFGGISAVGSVSSIISDVTTHADNIGRTLIVASVLGIIIYGILVVLFDGMNKLISKHPFKTSPISYVIPVILIIMFITGVCFSLNVIKQFNRVILLGYVATGVVAGILGAYSYKKWTDHKNKKNQKK